MGNSVLLPVGRLREIDLVKLDLVVCLWGRGSSAGVEFYGVLWGCWRVVKRCGGVKRMIETMKQKKLRCHKS